MANWKNGTSTGRTGAQLEASVIGETFINVDHPDYGGDIQAAIDAHTAGVMYIPGGTVRTQSSLITYPEKISFLGDGPDASVLSWPTDLGAGYAFAPESAVGSGPYHNNTIEGIGFRGESYSTALTMGTQATTQDGVRIARRTTVRRCLIRGFGRGLAISEDHASVFDCDINGNHWNLAWVSCPVSRFGNIAVEDVRIDYASMANILVEDDNKITDSELVRISGGLAPYGILSASGRAEGGLIVNSLLRQVNIEGYGNAVIKGETTCTITNSRILDSNNAYDATYKISATTYNACIDVGQFSFSTIDLASMVPLSTVPAVAPVYASGSGFGDTRFVNVSGNLINFSQSNTLPIWKSASTTPINSTFSTSGGASGPIVRAQGAIAQGDLCQINTTNVAAPRSSGIPIGVALCAAGDGLMCPVASSGPVTVAHADATGVTAQKYVKPSATTGRLAEATGFSDGPIIGISHGASSGANGTFSMQVRLGGWS